MNHLLASSVFAIALAACVETPAPAPAPSASTVATTPSDDGDSPRTPSPDHGGVSSADGNLVYVCWTAVPDHCVMISTFVYHAHDACVAECASLGYVNPVCGVAWASDDPCN
jgi:hypothetical protein